MNNRIEKIEMLYPVEANSSIYDGRWHNIKPDSLRKILLNNKEYYVMEYFDYDLNGMLITLLEKRGSYFYKIPLDNYDYLTDYLDNNTELEECETSLVGHKIKLGKKKKAAVLFSQKQEDIINEEIDNKEIINEPEDNDLIYRDGELEFDDLVYKEPSMPVAAAPPSSPPPSSPPPSSPPPSSPPPSSPPITPIESDSNEKVESIAAPAVPPNNPPKHNDEAIVTNTTLYLPALYNYNNNSFVPSLAANVFLHDELNKNKEICTFISDTVLAEKLEYELFDAIKNFNINHDFDYDFSITNAGITDHYNVKLIPVYNLEDYRQLQKARGVTFNVPKEYQDESPEILFEQAINIPSFGMILYDENFNIIDKENLESNEKKDIIRLI